MSSPYIIIGEQDIPRVMCNPNVRRPSDTSKLPSIPGADWGYWSTLTDDYRYDCWDCGVECVNPNAGDFRNYCPECGEEQ